MFLRPSRQRRALLVCAGLALAGPASAGVSLQAVVTASAGVTDNVASVPTKPPAGQEPRESDFLAVISPGLILTGGSPRAVQRLSYTFGGILYGKNSDADTYTNTASYAGFFLPTKTLSVGLIAGLAQGRTSAFNTAIASTDQPAQAQLAGVQNLLSLNVGQNLSWDLTVNWRLYENLGFGTSYYIDPPPVQGIAQTVPAAIGMQRRFARQAVSLEAGVTYTNFLEQRGPVTTSTGSINPRGIVEPQQGQIIATPIARYVRDLTYFLAGHAEIGASFVFDPASTGNHLIQPVGGAGLNINSKIAFFDISYSHSVQPNLLFISNFINDSATARGTILLGQRSGFSLQLVAGYTYGRQLDLTAHEDAIAQTFIGDATIFYTPRPELSFFLRYQIIDQVAHAVGNNGSNLGNAELGTIPALTTYYRNTLLFGITATYPAEAAVQVPRTTVGVRADRRDDGTITTSKSTPPSSQ